MWRTAKGKGKRELLWPWGTRLDNLPLTLCHSAPALLHSPTVMLVPTTLAPRQAGTLVTIQYRGNSSFKCRIRFRSCLARTVYITTSNWIHVFIFHARREDHRLFMHGRFIDQQNSYLLSFIWGGIPLQKTWFSTISVFQGTQSLAPRTFPSTSPKISTSAANIQSLYLLGLTLQFSWWGALYLTAPFPNFSYKFLGVLPRLVKFQRSHGPIHFL